jgi:enolase
MAYAIKQIFARQIYDGRGIPTIEVDVTTEAGIFRASVPNQGLTDQGMLHLSYQQLL